MHALWLQPQNPFGTIELVWKQDPTLTFFNQSDDWTGCLQSLCVQVLSSMWERTRRIVSRIATKVIFTAHYSKANTVSFSLALTEYRKYMKLQFSTNYLIFLKPLRGTCCSFMKLKGKWSGIRHILSWCRQDLWFLETVLRVHTGTAGS